jgi:hypothetical protein
MALFGFWMIPKNPQKRNRFKRSRRWFHMFSLIIEQIPSGKLS